MTYRVVREPHPEVPHVELVRLVSPEGVSASWAPTAGMVGVSLRHGDDELLGQRGGLTDYLLRGKTFGIPLLAPWANRLGGWAYAVDGRRVDVDPTTPGVRTDASGLPIHGLLAGCRDWVVGRAEAQGDAAVLTASLVFDAARPEFPAFPFEHRFDVEVRLAGTTLTVGTTLTATGDVAVPVAFGWHPYLAPPVDARDRWRVSLPFERRAVLDDRGVPTGEVVDDPAPAGRIEDTTLDDCYVDVVAGAVASVAGDRQRLSVRYDEGFPVTQVWAPADPQVVACEPMTAPADPFSARLRPLRLAAPGESVTARFSLLVTPV